MIESVQYCGDIAPVRKFIDHDCLRFNPVGGFYYIVNGNEEMPICNGDYVVKDSNGEFHLCKQEIFEAQPK